MTFATAETPSSDSSSFNTWFCDVFGLASICKTLESIAELSVDSCSSQLSRRGSELRRYDFSTGMESTILECKVCSSPLILSDGTLVYLGGKGVFHKLNNDDEPHEIKGSESVVRILGTTPQKDHQLLVVTQAQDKSYLLSTLNIRNQKLETWLPEKQLPNDCSWALLSSVSGCRAITEFEFAGDPISLVLDDARDVKVKGNCLSDNPKSTTEPVRTELLPTFNSPEYLGNIQQWSRFDPVWTPSKDAIVFIAKPFVSD